MLMFTPAIKLLSVSLLCLALLNACSNSTNANQPSSSSHAASSATKPSKGLLNVPYRSVTEQPFTDADHRLSYGEDAQHYGLLWLPKSAQGNKPLVVFIHGGCWLSAFDISHSRALTSAIAAQGYPVWSLEYRRSGHTGGGWPTTYHDVIRGVAASEQLKSFGVDISQIVLVGHSAGGHLALLTGANWHSTEAFQDLPAQLVATVGLAAITDVVAYSQGENSCETATPQFMGGTPVQFPSAYEQANPAAVTQWQNTWLLQGSADSIVDSRQASLNGATTQLLEGGGHFDWIHPNSTGFEMLLALLAQL